MVASKVKAALAAGTLLYGLGSAQSCPATPSVTIEISPVAVLYGSSTITSYTTLTVTDTVLGPQQTSHGNENSASSVVGSTTGAANSALSTPAVNQPSSSAFVAPSFSGGSGISTPKGTSVAGIPASQSISQPTAMSVPASSNGIPASYTTETLHDGTMFTTYTIPPSGTNMGTVIVEQPTIARQDIITETIFYAGSDITSYTIFGSNTETIMVEMPSSYENLPTSGSGIPALTSLTASSTPILESSSGLLSSLQSTAQVSLTLSSDIVPTQLSSAIISSLASTSAAVSGPALSLSSDVSSSSLLSNALTTSQPISSVITTSQAVESFPTSSSDLLSGSSGTSVSVSSSAGIPDALSSSSSILVPSSVPSISSEASSSLSTTNSNNLLITGSFTLPESSVATSSLALTTSDAVQSSLTSLESFLFSASSSEVASSSSPVVVGYVTETIYWTGSVVETYTIPPANGQFGTVVVEEPSVTLSLTSIFNSPSVGTNLPLPSSTGIYQNNTVTSATSIGFTIASTVSSSVLIGSTLPSVSSSAGVPLNQTTTSINTVLSTSAPTFSSVGTNLPLASSSVGIFQNQTSTFVSSELSTSVVSFPSVGTSLPLPSSSSAIYQNQTSTISSTTLGYVTETIFWTGSVATTFTIPPSNGQFGTVVVEEPSTTPSPTPSFGTSIPMQSSSSAVYFNTTSVSTLGILTTSAGFPSSSLIGTAPLVSPSSGPSSAPVFANTTSIAQLPSSTILPAKWNTTTSWALLSTSSWSFAPIVSSTASFSSQANTTISLPLSTSISQVLPLTTSAPPVLSSVSGVPVSSSPNTGIWNSTIISSTASSSSMSEIVSLLPLNGTSGTSSAGQQAPSSMIASNSSAILTTTAQSALTTSGASIGSVIAYITETGYYNGNATFTTTYAPAHSGDTETVVIVEPIKTTTVSQVYSGNQTITTTLPLNQANPAVQTVVVEVPAVYITSYEGWNGTRTLTQIFSSSNATTVDVVIETPTAGYVTETIFYTGSAEITGAVDVTIAPNGPTSGTVFVEVPANYVTETSFASIASAATVTEAPSAVGQTGTIIVEVPITQAATATFLTTTQVYPGYGPTRTTQYPRGPGDEGFVIYYTGTSSATSTPSPTTSVTAVTGASSAYTSTYTTGSTTVTEYGCPTPPSSCGAPGLEYAVHENPYAVDPVKAYESSFDVDYFKLNAPNATGYTQFIHLDSNSGGPDTIYGLNYNFQNDQYTVEHRGWFYACETGFYDISFHYTDDINFLWIYNNAYSGWTNTTAAIEQEYGNNGSPETIRVYLNSGDYMPMRVMYANGGGNALSIFSILGPDGLEKGGCGTPDYEPTNSPFYISNLSTECDASAQVFPDYGAET